MEGSGRRSEARSRQKKARPPSYPLATTEEMAPPRCCRTQLSQPRTSATSREGSVQRVDGHRTSMTVGLFSRPSSDPLILTLRRPACCVSSSSSVEHRDGRSRTPGWPALPSQSPLSTLSTDNWPGDMPSGRQRRRGGPTTRTGLSQDRPCRSAWTWSWTPADRLISRPRSDQSS